MKCFVCSARNTDSFAIQRNLFCHLGFTDASNSGRIGFCQSCGSIFNPAFNGSFSGFERTFASKKYAHSGQSHHTLRAEGFPRPVTRSRLQAELLAPHLGARPRVLDIGCFDGLLLKELARKKPRGTYHGHDINAHLGQLFPKRDNFAFHHGPLEELQGAYDLACLSHSIFYLPDLDVLKETLRRVVKPGGLLFVQAANFEKNPCALLLGDQHIYLEPRSLDNLFRHLGFEPAAVDNPWFPRELLRLGRRRDKKFAFGKLRPPLPDSLARLEDASLRLRALPGGMRLSVLGATINAAWVDGELGKRLSGFVNEAPHSSRIFRGKPVRRPRELGRNDLLILPYWASNDAIERRFRKMYPRIGSYSKL